MKHYPLLTREEALSSDGIINPELRAIHHKMAPYLALIAVKHWGYDGSLWESQLVVHEAMQDAFRGIFAELLEVEYPIERMRPAAIYGWQDSISTSMNNTSVYRPDFVGDPADGKVSEHTRGSALDLNPQDNPLFSALGAYEPPFEPGRRARQDALIFMNPAVIDIFNVYRMEYGGYWTIPGSPDYYPGDHIPQDFHHFELRPQHVHELDVPEGIWVPPQTAPPEG